MRKRLSLLRSLLGNRRRSKNVASKPRVHRSFESLEDRNLLAVVPIGDQGLINETVIRDQHSAAHSVSAAIGGDLSSIVVYDGREALNGEPNGGQRDREGIFVARYDRAGCFDWHADFGKQLNAR